MYIPEFWVGVGAAILAEIVLVLAIAFIVSRKHGNDDEK